MNVKTASRKVLSVLLVMCMLAGLVPLSAFAYSQNADGTVSATTTTSTTHQAYVPVTSVDSEGTYLIVSGSYAMYANGSSLASGTVSVSSGSITVGDNTYSSYIDAAAITSNAWKWTVSGGVVRNVDTGAALYGYWNYGRASLSLSDSNSSNWTYNGSSLSTTVNSTTYYLRNNYGYSWSLSSTSYGSSVTLYKLVEYTTTSTSTVTYSVSAEDIVHVFSTATGNTETIAASVVPSGSETTLGGDWAYEIRSNENSIVTLDGNVLSFTGAVGMATVRVSYSWTADGEVYTVYTDITVTARKSNYFTPADGATNFPDYPAPGAVVIDKTASAVGNFNETGIVEMELSMFGVPVTSDTPVDVVIVFDATKSMEEAAYGNVSRVEAAETAAVDFVNVLYNNGIDARIGLVTFGTSSNRNNASSHYQDGTALLGMTQLNQSNKSQIESGIQSFSNKISGGNVSNYAGGLARAYKMLTDSSVEGRKQFVVFLSDGGANYYYTAEGSMVNNGTIANQATKLTNWSDRSSSEVSGYLYQAAINVDGTRYSAGWYTRNSKYHYEYWSNQLKAAGVTVFSLNSAMIAESEFLMNDIAGPAHDTTRTPNSDDYVSPIAKAGALDMLNKYYFEYDESNPNALGNALKNIAHQISAAASDVTVEDVVTDEYELIFSLPSAVDQSNVPAGQEFYIEVVKYSLDEDCERDGVNDATLMRIYVDDGGAYYYDNGTKTYYGDTVTVTDDGGNVQTITCPYFTYDAQGHDNGDGTYSATFTWNTDELSDDYELALRYFLYLTGSMEGEVPAGTYDTNKYATISYENHLGNPCQKEFPVPQQTWAGAQVSFVFYLVDANGNPVNQSGQSVDFRSAVFVTQTVTRSVIWEETNELNVSQLAADILPDGYTLFDEDASYAISVYANPDAEKVNTFTISGSESGGTSASTTQVYNTTAGNRYSAYGTYTSGNVVDSFNFYDTTVAFAVVWTASLTPDTVVVDFGLPVDINVVTNDLMENTVHGVSVTNPGYPSVNTGASTFGTSDTGTGFAVEVRDSNTVRFTQTDMTFQKPATFYYDSEVNYYKDGKANVGYMYTSVTVIPATSIYYEDDFVTFSEGDWSVEGQVVDAVQDVDRPGDQQIVSDAYDANNPYGYDSAYKSMSTYSMGAAHKATVTPDQSAKASFTFYGTGFDVVSLTSTSTGTIVVNVKDMSGDVVKSLVVDTYYGYTFNGYTYYKTAHTYVEILDSWDVRNYEIDADTYNAATDEAKPVDPTNGDVYYTYAAYPVWEVVADTDNALYQVPVMKVEGLPYGKYNVEIIAAYAGLFDHTGEGSYDFYLDAVRVYDPCGEDETAQDAYQKDNEAYPVYHELRNLIIDAADLATNKVNGIVFIDGKGNTASVADYISYGPNNELYLTQNQSIAFDLNAENAASVQLAIKTAGGSGSVKVYSVDVSGNVATVALDGELSTATDMYYDITALNGSTVVVTNTGSGILSLTNLKVTYSQAPEEDVQVLSISYDTAECAVMSLNATVQPEPEPSEEEIQAPTQEETEAPTEEETEPTVPETTETPEPEQTQPPTEKPEQGDNNQSIVKTIGKVVKSILGWLFG